MRSEPTPYRDAKEEVARHAQRLLAMQSDMDIDKLGTIYRWRWARIGFGRIGVVAATIALLLVVFATESQVLGIGLAWATAFAGAFGGYLWAGHRFARHRARLLGHGVDPHDLVLRLSKASGSEDQGDAGIYQTARLGLSSHRLPLLVGAMLLPMTLVAGFFALTEADSYEVNNYMRYGLLYTIHVHIYAMAAAWRFPLRQRAIAVIAIASGVGVIPFLLSGLVVGAVATIIMTLYFIPLSYWVNRENRWLISEQEKRIASHPEA